MNFRELYESRARRLQLISAWPAHRQHYALHKWLKDNRERYEQEIKIEKKVTRNVF